MATYNTAFGSLPGYNEMLGTTNTTGGGQQAVYGQPPQQRRQAPQSAQTFAQMQQQGMARPPAPTAPQAQPFAQYGGSQQAQQMRQRLQEQLAQFGQQPSRYDTQAFQQIRGAQAANLQAEYQGQQKALNEELARRGIYSSSIAGGRLGDLAGQQARALSSLDAQLLQQAAETQAQDRAQLLQAGQGLAELAGSQDLAQFEANRVAQAATFENQLRAAQFGQQQFEAGGAQALQGAQAEQAARQFQQELGLRMGEMTGQVGGAQTLAARQQAEQRRQFDVEQQLRQVLGLGGLGLQERQQAAQEAQFGQTLAEQQAARLQQAGLSQQEINLRAQQLQQEAATQGRQISLEEARLQVQQQQFGATQAQQQAQFAAQLGETQAARLQQYGVTQQELGLRSQQLQQEAQLQGRQLSIQEAQNQAGNQIERERMAQQGQQFGLQLGETQTARLQQYGLSVQELGLRSQQLQQEAALQGRQMSIAEAQNLAQNGLEQQKITQQATQFGLQLNEQQAQRLQQGGFTAQELALEARKAENQVDQFGRQLSAQERQNAAINTLEQQKVADDRAFRSQQLGLNSRELDIRASQIQQQLAQSGQQITNEQAYRQAEIDLRSRQLIQEGALQGRQIDVDQARIQAQRDLSAADNTAQMARLTAQISSQEKVAGLETQLRRQLGMMEATGQVYTVGPDGQLMAGGDTLESQLRRAQLTGTLGGQSTLDRLQQQLQQAQFMTQQTGNVFRVNPQTGAIEQAGGTTIGGQIASFEQAQAIAQAQTAASGEQFTAQRDPNTGMYSVVARGAQSEARRQFDLENRLKQVLGLTEASGYMYDPVTGQPTTRETVQGQIARSQILMALVQSLGSLDPDKLAALLKGNTPPADPNKTDPTKTGTDGMQMQQGSGQESIEQLLTLPASPRENWVYNIAGTLVRYRGGKFYKADGSEYTRTAVEDQRDKWGNPWTPPPPMGSPPTNPQTDGATTPPPAPPPASPTGTTPFNPAYLNTLPTPRFMGQYQASNFSPSGWAVYTNGQWMNAPSAPTYSQQSIPGTSQKINAYPGYRTFLNGYYYLWDGSKWLSSDTP